MNAFEDIRIMVMVHFFVMLSIYRVERIPERAMALGCSYSCIPFLCIGEMYQRWRTICSDFWGTICSDFWR
jgi:hypothetical protein